MVCEAVPGAKGAQRKRKVHQYTHTKSIIYLCVKWKAVVRALLDLDLAGLTTLWSVVLPGNYLCLSHTCTHCPLHEGDL